MRAATAVGATAILIVVAEMWACAAGAQDAIKPGKWEFWIVGSPRNWRHERREYRPS